MSATRQLLHKLILSINSLIYANGLLFFFFPRVLLVISASFAICSYAITICLAADERCECLVVVV